jgi:hypothetical protein
VPGGGFQFRIFWKEPATSRRASPGWEPAFAERFLEWARLDDACVRPRCGVLEGSTMSMSTSRRALFPDRPARRAGRRRAFPRVDLLEARELLTLLGQQLFPSNYPWNQNIAAAPVASNSTAIINNIINLYGNGRFHPDFGQDTQSSNPLYGIPFNVVHGSTQSKVNVVIDAYASESDVQPAPIPPNAVLEGDNQNGPVTGLANRGDSHLIVWDEDHNIAYEFYNASRPSENADGKWHAAQESVWNMNTDQFRPLDWTSADAAGLAILPGLLRPDEAVPVSQGGQGVINHAIRVTLKNNIILDQFLYPASHIANSGTNAAVQPPMGARLRLKASVDISTLNPESQVVARAMQDYGLIVADNGSNFFASGASYSVDASNNFAMTWNDNDIQDTTHGLKSLTYSDFEVVDLTPVVTGLSASSGSAGSTITVTGANFSGAAGHLQVLFNNTAATNVTVLDDGHVTAVVPAGTGTVDVRVQSGVTTSPDSENIKNPIFGYGISAVSTADQFTYGGSTGNQPPTVAQPASATPNPVTATTTALAVLGADDGGEANLTYTWQATAAPAGANPVFSANNTNAAKNTTVTFNRAGAYTFLVTITDSGGLSVTSSVNVTVNQIVTTIVVSPGTVTLVNGAKQQFTAQALDQFSQPLTIQPSFTWSKFSGIGSINKTGLYTAPSRGKGTAVVQAQASGKAGQATITIVSKAAARVHVKKPHPAQQPHKRRHR